MTNFGAFHGRLVHWCFEFIGTQSPQFEHENAIIVFGEQPNFEGHVNLLSFSSHPG